MPDEYSIARPERESQSRASHEQVRLLRDLAQQMREYDGIEAARIERRVSRKLGRHNASKLIDKTIKLLRQLERECDV